MLPTDLLPPPDRIVVVPSDLADALESAPEALHFFESMPYRRQRLLVARIEDARVATLRQRRIALAVERLRAEGGAR
jgi:uncharacterized protein YdeI (YjbR/CyaY-like superfamily)